MKKITRSLLDVSPIFSIFIYVVLFNLATNFYRVAFNLKPQLLIIASYCKTGLPNIINSKLIYVAILVMFTKLAIYVFSISYFRKKQPSNALSFYSSILVSFIFIEILSVAVFGFDKINGSNYFKYFASTLHFFNLGIQTDQLYLCIILNTSLSIIALYLILKSCYQFHLKKALKILAYTVLSIIILIIFSEIYNAIT